MTCPDPQPSDDAAAPPPDGLGLRVALLQRIWSQPGHRPAEDLWPGYEQLVAEQMQRLDAAEVERWIGPYRILREHARGGQAVVYEAVSPAPQRRVALKVLQLGKAQSGRALARFRREAELLSRLEARGICPVYETGEDHDQAWIAMRFIPGPSLAARLAEWRSAPGSRPDRGTRLGIVIDILHTLAAAHGLGVVHRDIKPGNVLMGEDGPVLVDFGLACSEADSLPLTRSGDSFGTPAYMAPEQLAEAAAGVAADLFSVGVLLYELLEGRHPFMRHGSMATQLAIAQGRRHPLRKGQRSRTWLRRYRAILDTALAARPERRYASAAQFAADLEALRDQRPVAARRSGWNERLLLAAARRPGVSVLTLLVLLLGTVFGLVALDMNAALRREQDATGRALEDARIRGLTAASAEQRHRDPQLGLLLGREAFARRADPSTRSNLLACLQRSHLLRHVPAPAAGVALTVGTAWDSEVLCAYSDGSLRAVPAAGPARVLRPDGSGARILAMQDFRCADGSAWLCCGREDGGVEVFDAELRLRAQARLPCGVVLVAAAPRGSYLAGSDGRIYQLSAAPQATEDQAATTLQLELFSEIQLPRIRVLHAHPDGGLLVSSARAGCLLDGRGRQIRAWRTAGYQGCGVLPDGRILRVPQVPRPQSLAQIPLHLESADGRDSAALVDFPALVCRLAADGVRLLVGGQGVAALVRLGAGEGAAPTVLGLAGHAGRVRYLDFAGEELLTASEDHALRVFGPRGELRAAFAIPGFIRGAGFLRGGEQVYALDGEGTLRIWSRRAAPAWRSQGPLGVAVTRAGTTWLVAESAIRLRELGPDGQPSGAALQVRDLGPIDEIQLSDDGARMLLRRRFGQTTLCDRQGRELARIPWWSTNTKSAFLDPGGRRVLSCAGGRAFVWDESGRANAQAPALPFAIRGFAVLGGSGLALLHDAPHRMKLWAPGSRALRELQVEGVATHHALSADGKTILVGTMEGALEVLEIDGSRRAQLAVRGAAITALCARQGGAWASGATDGSLRLWDQAGELSAVLSGHRAPIAQLQESSSGAHLLSLDSSGLGMLWTRDGRLWARLPELAGGIHQLDFDPEGEWILAVGKKGQLCRWPVRDQELQALVRRRVCRQLSIPEREGYALPLDTPLPDPR